ncbi:MAG TPA: hypothetical protein ENN66_10310 [Proteobacteria bacterium]|nr:hypothetical protein [Pseudomonadota bacterium]
MKDKRLIRINLFILAMALVLTASAGLIRIDQIGITGVAVGGFLALTYFFLLSVLISKAFAGAGQDGIEGKAAGKLGLKLLLLTVGMAIITIIVILTKLCQPFGFLIGFSALFGGIAFETMAYLAFSKSSDLSPDHPEKT